MRQSQRRGAVAPCSGPPEESEIKSAEYQDNANVHCQPFPKSVSEKQEIYADYDGCHRHHVKHYCCLSAHFGIPRTSYTETDNSAFLRPAHCNDNVVRGMRG